MVVVIVAGCGRIGFVEDEVLARCGNTVLDPAETCDDGNGASGDGCDRSCQLEPAFTCPTPGKPCLSIVGLSAKPEVLLPGVGGGGGTEFQHDCAAGELLVGFESRVLDGNLTMINGTCARASFGGDGALAWSNPMPTPVVGEGNGDPLPPIACRPDEVVIGFIARTGPKVPFVQGLQLLCRSLAFADGELVFGSSSMSGSLGVLGPEAMTQGCPNTTVARAFGERAGIVLDQVTLRCDEITAIPCGDALVTPPETCDDGNAISGDGCSARCQIE